MKKRFTPVTLLGIVFKMCLIVIFVFPFYWMIVTAFKTYQETLLFPPSLLPAKPQWVNFKEVWTSGPYLLYLRNSIVMCCAVLIMQAALMIPAAFSFAKYNFIGKSFLFGIVMVSFMMPGQVTFISLYNMMSRAKLLKTLWPQIIPFAASAFGIFMLRQAFMQIPNELLESARIDSANELQVLVRIMLPIAKPTLVSIMMLSFISNWNDYFWPFIMCITTETYPLTLGIAALRDVEGAHAWHIIMAGNVILVVPIIIVYAIFHKRIVNVFAHSGIK